MSFWKKPAAESTATESPSSASNDTPFDLGDVNPQLVEAKYQVEAVTDMFQRMSKTCFEKCLGKHKDNQLNVGEQSCIDRCVVKYIETQTTVGLKLREGMEAQAQMMMAQQQQ
jgi:hypothetical protein